MAVCCLDDKGEWARELEGEGITVAELRRPEGFRPSVGRAVAAAARRHRADVIHCHHYSPFVYACVARLWPRWSMAPPLVFTEHGRLSDAQPSPKRRMVNRVLSRMPRRVFAVSENLKRHMVGEGFSDSQVGVIYNGIDARPEPAAAARASARQQLGVDEQTLVVGTIARLDPVKDLGTLIRAVAALAKSRRVLLVIVGDGPERARLEETAAAVDAERHVRFLGHRNDARDWLAGCDVYVNCSISEGVSLTILEAMAARLPIVATRVGGTPEVVDESCARLVPSRDPDALAAALAELADRPAIRQQLGAAARRRVVERFSIDRMVRDYRDVYYSVA